MNRSVDLEVDFHVHSEASYDGHEPVELILEHAADIGLDAVVVTDHDVIHASLDAAVLAEEYGLVGIPGVEISTAEGHLLAIGVKEMPESGQSMGETVAAVDDLDGASIVPHPFQRTRHGVRKRRLNGVDPDAIETFNAWLFTGYRNRRARRYATRYGYPAVGGSDAHSLLTVGRAYTELTVEKPFNEIDSDDIVAAIQRGNTGVRGQRASIQRASGHYAKAAGRKTAWGMKTALKKSGSGARYVAAAAAMPFR
ncbi:PHP-associated domain-containing protein [Natronomonas salsuginis]|uniref:PHP domain-containing protein n=1 Tax=Natronomonas salsuginis TaxID=2217661 RepID=A0A4U5JE34_9EURY|nr:PHP domain-containing protein [Natronomonas salsuginis]TKR25907.1 PHP domain-containing protein [Natronomonas salsuginis]